MESLTLSILVFSTFLALLIPALIWPNRIMRWLKLKIYGYQVNFAIYMLSPLEQFIINSLLFLSVSMIIIAAFLYLPEHIATISHRAFYYWSGYTKHRATHGSGIVSAASATAASIAEKVVGAGQNIRSAGQDFAHEFAKAARVGEKAADGIGSAAGAMPQQL